MTSPQTTIGGFCNLSDLGVIRAEGVDAARFLHGQLTNDVLAQQPGQARLAAFCSAKGRMIASFVLVKVSDELLFMVCQIDVLAKALKRLQMFVLRAKVSLSDATMHHRISGELRNSDGSDSTVSGALWTATQTPQGTAVVLPSSPGWRRLLWIAGAEQVASVESISPNAWDLEAVRSGLAMVGLAQSELFLPQMLNYESLSGVSFKKGCYPGQEVVARSQFRGAIKRRAFIVNAELPMATGADIHTGDQQEEPVGVVVAAAKAGEALHWEGIACVQVSSFELGELFSNGKAIKLRQVPYPLLDDL